MALITGPRGPDQCAATVFRGHLRRAVVRQRGREKPRDCRAGGTRHDVLAARQQGHHRATNGNGATRVYDAFRTKPTEADRPDRPWKYPVGGQLEAFGSHG